MPKRDVRLFLHEMLQAMDKIHTYLAGYALVRFESEPLVQDAVIRNLEVIGEAARQVPDDVQARYPDIPWGRIIGFRNVAIHAYFDVDLTIVWRIATENLPGLRDRLQAMLNDLGGLPSA